MVLARRETHEGRGGSEPKEKAPRAREEAVPLSMHAELVRKLYVSPSIYQLRRATKA